MRGLTGPERDILLEACKLEADDGHRKVTQGEMAVIEVLVRHGRMQDMDGLGWRVTPAGREAIRIDSAIRVTLIG